MRKDKESKQRKACGRKRQKTKISPQVPRQKEETGRTPSRDLHHGPGAFD